MRFPRRPQTVRQWGTIVGMAIVLVGFVVFLAFEIPGMIDPAAEDTLTEWVADLAPGWVWPISIVMFLGGGMAVWAGPHFWEHYIRRRKQENRDD